MRLLPVDSLLLYRTALIANADLACLKSGSVSFDQHISLRTAPAVRFSREA